MAIEYEATFCDVNKNEIREKLKKAGATLVKPEFMQKRIVFDLPEGHQIKGGWLRVRDEQDKITMSLKIVNGDKIENQQEICLKVDSFSEAVEFLKTLNCPFKAYQESKRELWILDEVEVTIDEWPYLEPYVEIEGKSEGAVKQVSKKLAFNYSQAIFGAVDILYSKKYGIPTDYINHQVKRITFADPNPFKVIT